MQEKLVSLFKKAENKIFISEKVYKIIIAVIFIWFTYQICFFAFNVERGIPPDEIFHIKYINLYSDNQDFNPIISEQSDNYDLGQVTRLPSFFYQFITGNIIQFFPFNSTNQLFPLRILNVIFAIFTVYFFLKTMNLLTKDKWIKIASLFMLTNTLMFVFISMSVNYDAACNLVAIISIFLLIQIFKTKSFESFLFLLTVLIAGPIIKISFFPLTLIIGFIAVTYLIVSYKFQIFKKFWEYIKQNKIKSALLIIVLLIFSALFMERYLGNYLRYSSIDPKCDQVLDVEKCRMGSQFAVMDDYIKSGEKGEYINLFVYTTVWTQIMISRTFSIFGHLVVEGNSYLRAGFLALIFSFVVSFIKTFSFKKEKINLALLFIFLAYTFILFYFVNFKEQVRYGIIGLAVQGRYLFPVLPIFYYLINFYILKFLKFNLLKFLYLLFIVLLFLQGGLVWFIYKAPIEWYIYGSPVIFYGIKI